MTLPAWLSGHMLAVATRDEGDGSSGRLRVSGSGNDVAPRATAPDPADAALVERIRSGDSAALDELVDRYYAALVSYVARLLGSDDEAEDVVQELFVRLWRRREAWVLRGSLSVYLYSAARNTARDAIAARSSRSRAEGRAGAEQERLGVTGERSALDTLESEELTEAVRRAVADLSERSRDVYLLACQGMSSSEIGTVLGIAPSTVRTLLARAIATLDRVVGPLLS